MLRIKLDLSTLESDDSQSPAMRPPASPNYDRSARRLRTTPRTPKTPKTPKGDRSPLFFTPETFWPNTPSTPKDDSINRLTERLGALSIQTPGKQRETSQPKPTFDLNLSGSDASNCSNDSSYGFNNLSVNKALRGLLHNEQDLVASPILPRKPKIPPPSFYFPQGKPVSQAENTAALRRGLEVFRTIPGNVVNYENMDQLCQAVGIPVYWKKPMFSSILYPKLSGAITITEFSAFWTAMTTVAHDEAARFVYILTGGKATEIKREHLRPLIHDVILTHPGLAFYRTSVEFHDKYCDVVITRVFWNHRRTWALHITAEDLRRGDFLESVRQLELEEDINKNLRYFSYEHFYVVYCLFWEIDQDHDLKIRPDDLARHQRGAITRRVVERIFSRAVSKHPHYKTKEIGLVEFTQFLLADEDKQHPSSIDYWFRIMDEDGDGVISLYDMETYFGGIQEKLSEEGIDCMKFSDVACHLIDAIQPKKQNSFRRADFMNNKLSPKFFNSFVNFRKFYYQETTEGSEPRLEDASGQELTDWDRFCVEEYEALMDQSEADNVDSYDLYLEDDEETRAGSGTYNELL